MSLIWVTKEKPLSLTDWLVVNKITFLPVGARNGTEMALNQYYKSVKIVYFTHLKTMNRRKTYSDRMIPEV